MEPISYSFPSPGKLNLFLHITGRRPDGYHELQTVFHLLDYGDTLTFTPTNTPGITLSDTLNIPNEENLIWKAAQLLQENIQTRQDNGGHTVLSPPYKNNGYVINVEKRLPMGGGLGGGSSNAATTLLALNFLWDTQLSIDALADLGKTLGADVPVFVRGFSAWGEGIGEKLTPIELPSTCYLVVVPNCQVSTVEIFNQSELTRDTPRITIRDFLSGLGMPHNDMEALVRKQYPEIDEALNYLSHFSSPRMTGSGASVFASFDTQTQALSALKKLPKSFKGFIANGLNQSPLHFTLNKLLSRR